MNFFKKFGITFGNKKNKYLPETAIATETSATTSTSAQSVVTYATANGGNVCIGDKQAINGKSFNNENYRTLAMFDLKIEAPKYEGAIPDATIKFYPLSK